MATYQNNQNATLFAANLPFDATEDELRSWFAPVGQPIRVSFSKNTESGKPRGIAFITFASPEIAEAAIRNLAKREMRGREIHLDWSRERDRRAGPGTGPAGPSGGGGPPLQGGYGAHSSYGGAQGGAAQFGAPQGHAGVAMQPGVAQRPGMFPQSGAPPGPFQPGSAAGQGPGGMPLSGQQPNPAGTIILTADGRRIVLAPNSGLPAGSQIVVPSAPAGGAPAPQPSAGPPQVQQQMAFSVQQGGAGAAPVQQLPSRGHAMEPVPTAMRSDLPVGVAAAQNASAKVAQVLGAPHTALAPSQQQTSSVIAGMTPRQMYDVLRDLRGMIESNPERGRTVLRDNPSLTKAVFHAQILLGMVDPDAKPMEEQQRQADEEAAVQQKSVKFEGHMVPEDPRIKQEPQPQPTTPAAKLDENSQALLKRVLQMTDREIAQCSPEQQEQIRLLKQHAQTHAAA